MVLVDTGPLVALQNQREDHHRWSIEAFQSVSGPVVTCEAVLTETGFLLRKWPEAFDLLLEHVERGRIQVESLVEDAASLRKLMKKYRSVPMAYADACLVRLSEKFPKAPVLTLDTDFDVYRRSGRQVIPLLAPFRQR